MVSSRPANTDLRAAWRRRHAGSLSQGVKVVFLVARAEGELQQDQLEAEQARHGDIVQVRLEREDGWEPLQGCEGRLPGGPD